MSDLSAGAPAAVSTHSPAYACVQTPYAAKVHVVVKAQPCLGLALTIRNKED